MWSLNVLRLVALIAIGTAGHPDIAINGFHAQAGWICFNGVALGVLLAAQHVAWFQKHAAGVSGAETHENAALDLRGTRNPTAVYLAPFLSIIVASLITQSISSGFEWLYPLRFVGAAGVLLYFRDDYQRLNWRCGWLGTAAGLAVALLWLGAHYATSLTPAGMSQSPFVSGLTALSPLQRFLWITFRLLAAVVTVPIAEELCFRGFLARRLVSLDFEVVPFYILGATQILLSAAVFGLMHGRSWFAGILAGVAFAWVAKRSGRLGEAVGAHMVANLAIAVVVLVSKDYTLWS
jgi:exosortase E/protease (VPEID-CTERM system)